MMGRRLLPALPTLIAALFAACVLMPAASALVVPLSGWTPVGGDASIWASSNEECLIREDQYGQAFPALTTQQPAQAAANRLRVSLGKQGFEEVTTQPIPRNDGTWGVLASYVYTQQAQKYRVVQLLNSRSGILHTVSGSTLVGNPDPCAAAMRDFIRTTQ